MRSQIDADHARALKPGQLGHELAHQTKTDYRHDVADADFGDPDRVERDGAERGEARMLKRNSVRHSHDQDSRREDRLAVSGPLAAVSDAIAGLKLGDRR